MNPTTQADCVHSTPPTNTPTNRSTAERAGHYLHLEAPFRKLRAMVDIVQIIRLALDNGSVSPGVEHDALMAIVIDHLEAMVTNIVGNYNDRLRETAVRA
jgi:hypothetical protein